jgi:hypothetical protein
MAAISIVLKEKALKKISITNGSYNHNYFSVSHIIEMFPADTIGGSSISEEADKKIKILWGNAKEGFTDIAKDKNIFRNRALVREIIEEYDLIPGDTINIEKVDRYTFRVLPVDYYAVDVPEPEQTERMELRINRIIRDTKIAREVKRDNNFMCQLCNEQFLIGKDKPYVEAHHIKPLGKEHNGPDVKENIICVCPNHHALLDFGAIKLENGTFLSIDQQYINYHNNIIFQDN